MGVRRQKCPLGSSGTHEARQVALSANSRKSGILPSFGRAPGHGCANRKGTTLAHRRRMPRLPMCPKAQQTREDRQKDKALLEARKAGTAAPEKDVDGNDINPHIPA